MSGSTKILPWRVRVLRTVEVWVDVQAETSAQAEALARILPQVQSVFGGSATRADKAVTSQRLSVENE